MTNLNIAVVEDDQEARERISTAVGGCQGMSLCGVAATVASARSLLATAWPDVLLVDLGLPDGDGTELIDFVSSSGRPCDIMVITLFGDEKHVLRAIEAGASGYLLKEEDDAQIQRCIRELAAGGSPMSASIARHLLNRFRAQVPETRKPSPPVDAPAPGLTKREIEVLRLIAKGYNFNEISSLLNIAYHTVTSHVRNIYRKLAVHSRSEAVFEAAQRGLVQFSR